MFLPSVLIVLMYAAMGSDAEPDDLCLAPICIVGKPCVRKLPPCAKFLQWIVDEVREPIPSQMNKRLKFW